MSRDGRRPTGGASHDRLIRAERRRRRREQAGWRGRAAVPIAVLGGLLFVVGNVTSRMGVLLLPFDRHHLGLQFGGAAVAMVGLAWLGRKR